MSQVQIEVKATCISLYANALRKVMNSSLSLQLWINGRTVPS